MAEPAGKDRAALFGAGLLGIGGVAAAAASAHAGSDPRLLGAVALVCLAHAPALLALGLAGRRELMLRLGALLLFAGAALFSIDIAMRAFDLGRLFTMAAPSGGIAMMAGWLAIALAAFTARNPSQKR